MASRHGSTILFGGDLAVDGDYQLSSAVHELFAQAEHRVLNLEAPILINAVAPASKAGPNLAQSPSVISLLRQLRVQYVSGANNHLMDYGVAGLQQTQRQLAEHNIAIAGCGKNLHEAKQPLELGSEIRIICVCEEEFGIASSSDPGCYSMYPHTIIEQIQSLTAQNKIVIVYAHGGGEMIPVPSEYIVRRYHEFITAGATAVIGHHPHIPQGVEEYGRGVIAYSLGNFIHQVYPNSWGMLLTLTMTANNVISYQPHYIQLKNQRLDRVKHTANYSHYIQQVSSIMTNTTQRSQIQQAEAAQMYRDFYKGYLEDLFQPQPLWMRLYRWFRLSAAERKRAQATRDEHDRNMQLHLERNKSHAEFITTAQGLEQHTLVDERTAESNQLFQELQRFIQQTSS